MLLLFVFLVYSLLIVLDRGPMVIVDGFILLDGIVVVFGNELFKFIVV